MLIRFPLDYGIVLITCVIYNSKMELRYVSSISLMFNPGTARNLSTVCSRAQSHSHNRLSVGNIMTLSHELLVPRTISSLNDELL